MSFVSIPFAIFLPTVFCLYWFVLRNSTRSQNVLLVVASYVFYGWWDWRFLSLIAVSSIVDYTVGFQVAGSKNQAKRRMWLLVSIGTNIGLLGFFKYFNFFVESFIEAFAAAGIILHQSTLNVILPVGISFYTFQTLSYTIDIYRGRMKPTRDVVSFFAFVSFFPQLVAGPIERAHDLLPQFGRSRSFDYAVAANGMRQILWGLFKKVVIADSCAVYVNIIFADFETLPASSLALGVVLFAFQIYGDFSGYSDIAIGVSALFGFQLSRNFAYPYFATDIAAFWRRWHISLTTWFRDYVYIPLGGSRATRGIAIRNVFVIFIVSGFWHGANWTFIVWGFLNALYFLPLLIRGSNRRNLGVTSKGRKLPTGQDAVGMTVTFLLTCIAWIFFRSETVTGAFSYLAAMIDPSILTVPTEWVAIPIILVLVVAEWIQREKLHPLEIESLPAPLRWSIYAVVSGLILAFIDIHPAQDFIYFQF